MLVVVFQAVEKGVVAVAGCCTNNWCGKAVELLNLEVAGGIQSELRRAETSNFLLFVVVIYRTVQGMLMLQ